MSYIEPKLGYEVDAYFDHTKQSVSGTIISVNRRYGFVNSGTTPINPLVKIKLNGGGTQSFDASFIVATRKPEKYIDYSKYNDVKPINTPFMATHFVMNEVIKLLTQSRSHHIPSVQYNFMTYELFKIGVFSDEEFVQKPNKKRLKKWIKQNINRYIISKSELDKIKTKRYIEEEKLYWDDVAMDMDW